MMANWKYRIDFTGFWDNDEMDIAEKGKAAAASIRLAVPQSLLDWKSDNYDQCLDDIVLGFDNITGYDEVSPTEEFDGWLDQLYDYGDTEIAPFGKWPPNKRAWIATGF